MGLVQSPTTTWLIQSSTTTWLIQSSTTMWLIQCPTTMWQIQSPLQCGTIYKTRYDAALFTKSVATRHLKARCYTAILYKISKSFSQSPNTCLAFIFTKPKYLFGIYFYKAQIIIWHYFTKPKFLFGIYFYKVQMLIWHYFTKPKY